MSLSHSKRRANVHILRKISFVHASFMRVPNLHTAPKRHLIKIIITFVRKIDSYLEKYKFARSFEGLRLDQISRNFEELNKTPNKFSTDQL